MEQYFDGTWEFGTAKLVTKHGKWFLHIPMSKEFPELSDADVCNVVGVDLGVNFLAVSYDSAGKTTFFDGHEAKHRRAQYKKIRKELQQRKTASARRRLKKIGQRENRWMQDVNHQVSKALAAQNPAGTLFVLEDLTAIRNVTEKVVLKQRYEMVSWAFFDLRKKLEYKSQLYGSKTIIVDPKYTSQKCPHCGYVHKLNRNKKKHSFTCRQCGYRSNDDRIGAMNLCDKGIQYLSSAVAVG
jgi:IS605 OrfB family transposase